VAKQCGRGKAKLFFAEWKNLLCLGYFLDLAFAAQESAGGMRGGFLVKDLV